MFLFKCCCLLRNNQLYFLHSTAVWYHVLKHCFAYRILYCHSLLYYLWWNDVFPYFTWPKRKDYIAQCSVFLYHPCGVLTFLCNVSWTSYVLCSHFSLCLCLFCWLGWNSCLLLMERLVAWVDYETDWETEKERHCECKARYGKLVWNLNQNTYFLSQFSLYWINEALLFKMAEEKSKPSIAVWAFGQRKAFG